MIESSTRKPAQPHRQGMPYCLRRERKCAEGARDSIVFLLINAGIPLRKRNAGTEKFKNSISKQFNGFNIPLQQSKNHIK